MAAAVVAKYARPPGEVLTFQASDGEIGTMDASENIRIVSRQNAVLEIFRLIQQGDIAPLNMSLMPAAQPVPYEHFDRRLIRREQAAQILQGMFDTTPAPQPQAAAPAPVVAGSAEQRQARRWQMCLDAGLSMPQDTYSHLPRGINEIAKAEGIERQGEAQNFDANDLAQRDGADVLAELLEGAREPAPPPLPLSVAFADELPAAFMPPDELVEGVLTAGDGSVLYGDSNSGKTFFVIDMAAAVARGAQWMGRNTEPGLVVYLAAETRCRFGT